MGEPLLIPKPLASISIMKYFGILITLFLILHSSQSSRQNLLPEGKWVNTKDSLAFIVTNGDTWLFKHKSAENSENRVYNYEIKDSLKIYDKYQKGKFLVLTNDENISLSYSGLEYDSESISMFYIPRGNYHEYRRVD